MAKREASNELRRLRSMKKNSIDPLGDSYEAKTFAHQRLVAELGALGASSLTAGLHKENVAGQETMRTLRAELAELEATIRKRAERERHPPTRETIDDIRWMWEREPNVHQICEWILVTERKDGFSAFREVLSQVAFTSPHLIGMIEGPMTDRTVARWIADQEAIILKQEVKVMPPEQVAALEELNEVQGMMPWLERNFTQMEAWLDDRLNGIPTQRPELTEWYELAGVGALQDRQSFQDTGATQWDANGFTRTVLPESHQSLVR